jgi:hypothetical protein
MAPRHVSTTEYARYRGIAPRSVRKAIEHGRLARSVARDGRDYVIDVEMADQEWKAATDVARGGRREALKLGSDYAEAKRRRVIIECDLLALELAEREAQLVEAVAVERERRREAERVIDAFMALPFKLSEALASANDAFEVHRILTQALRAELLRLSA